MLPCDGCSAPHPHPLAGRAPLWLASRVAAQEEAHLLKGLPSEVQGNRALPRLSACSLQPQCDGRCCPWTCHCPVESMTRTKLLPQPPPLPFPAFFIFFSIKICLRCSSIRAWRINIAVQGQRDPRLESPAAPTPGSINPGLLSKEWFSVNLSYQQKPLKEFV